MTLYKNKYRIESNRWQIWDYSTPGSYFITICIDGRREILGEINDGKMNLSESGRIVADHFSEIPTYHKRIILDEWVVMPNHIHCIITLGGYDYDNGIAEINDNDGGVKNVEKIHKFSLQSPSQPSQSVSPPQPSQPVIPPQFQPPQHQPYYQTLAAPTPDEIKQYRKMRRQMLIPKILGKLQMQTSKQINILNNTPGKRTWQFNYHDHVFRNKNEYWLIKNYIINNPQNWHKDKFNKNKEK